MTQSKETIKETKTILKTTFNQIEVDEETKLMSNNPKFLEILEQARKQKAKGGLSSEEMRHFVENELSLEEK